jgi:hypothetical protein
MSDIVERLRNAPNWMREESGSWGFTTHVCDHAPFEAADEIEKLRAALRGLIEYVEKKQCDHLTLRRGTFWTFCDNCGGKWASDEWDFRPPKKELKEVATARATLGEKG